jgi:hypothetical protein
MVDEDLRCSGWAKQFRRMEGSVKERGGALDGR